MADDREIKNHPAERRLFLVRTLVAVVVMTGMLGVLATRMGWLQISKHDYYHTRSRDNRMRVQIIQPVRGLIYDRNGQVLAENLPAYRLVVIPEQVKDMDAALQRLSKYVHIDDDVRQRFEQRLAYTPSFRPVPIRLDLNQREVARFEVNQYRFPNMRIRAGLRRYYPEGKITSHLVGYVGSISEKELFLHDSKRYRGATRIGKSGVEREYESRLRGHPGSRIVETNASGRTVRQIKYHPPESGQNLYLTIDAHLQSIAYHALGDNSGAVVAINPQNGEVLAMVSKPGYDPNQFVGGISYANYQKLINDPRNPLYHRALQGQYPPGSVVKPVMAIAALESGVISPQKKVWCPWYITLDGSSHRYHGWRRGGMGWVDMHEAIMRSSDVYFYKQAIKMGIEPIHKYGSLFGLGHRTGIDLPGEKSGIMPSPAWKRAHRNASWYPGETLITVIGQGYTMATPLQLAQMTSLIAARGRGFQPHVLQAVKKPEFDQARDIRPKALKPIVLKDPNEWHVAISGMEAVINSPRGTAHHYAGQHLEYELAGKSGTAQVTEHKQGVIRPEVDDMPYNLRPHALFIAFAPVDDPQIAVAVIVEHGGGGSSVASPIARQVIDAWLLHTPSNQIASAEPTPHDH